MVAHCVQILEMIFPIVSHWRVDERRFLVLTCCWIFLLMADFSSSPVTGNALKRLTVSTSAA